MGGLRATSSPWNQAVFRSGCDDLNGQTAILLSDVEETVYCAVHKLLFALHTDRVVTTTFDVEFQAKTLTNLIQLKTLCVSHV